MSPNRPAGGWEPAGWLSLKIILCRWSLIEKEFNNRSNDLILIRHRVCAQAAPGGLMVGTGVKSLFPARGTRAGRWVSLGHRKGMMGR